MSNLLSHKHLRPNDLLLHYISTNLDNQENRFFNHKVSSALAGSQMRISINVMLEDAVKL